MSDVKKMRMSTLVVLVPGFLLALGPALWYLNPAITNFRHYVAGMAVLVLAAASIWLVRRNGSLTRETLYLIGLGYLYAVQATWGLYQLTLQEPADYANRIVPNTIMIVSLTLIVMLLVWAGWLAWRGWRSHSLILLLPVIAGWYLSVGEPTYGWLIWHPDVAVWAFLTEALYAGLAFIVWPYWVLSADRDSVETFSQRFLLGSWFLLEAILFSQLVTLFPAAESSSQVTVQSQLLRMATVNQIGILIQVGVVALLVMLFNYLGKQKPPTSSAAQSAHNAKISTVV